MMKLNIKKSLKSLSRFEKIFLVFLIVSQVYYFYRYLFEYGSNFSPKNYALTPSYLQYGKYLIALVFLIILFFLLVKRIPWREILAELLKQKFWILLAFFLIYSAVSLLKFGVNPSSFGVTQTAKMLFVVPFAFFLPFVFKEKHPFDLLKLFLVFSFLYHLVYEAISLLAFALFKRLPSLAFSNLLPRFGGGWDDPNSFAAFALLLILVLMVMPRSKNKKENILVDLLFIGTVFAFFLAYSITALIGLVGCLIVLLICRKLNFLRLALLIASAIVFVLIHYWTGYLHLLLVAKEASSGGHLAAVHAETISGIRKVIQVVFGTFSNALFHENIYLQTYFNYGLVGVASLVLIEVATIYRAFAGWLQTSPKDFLIKNYFFVSFVYLGAFAVMNIGIPFFQIYPINLFVWLIIGSIWALPIVNFDKDKSGLLIKLNKLIRAFIKGEKNAFV